MIYGNRLLEVLNKSEDTDKAFIGTVELSEKSLNESLTGRGKDLGEFKVFVYGDEGKIPHFHLTDHNRNLIACICLAEPKYFSHGTHHSEKLTNNQQEDLYKFMKKPNKKNPKITNWEFAVKTWEDANQDKDYEYKGKMTGAKNMPDYSNINGERIGESKEDKEKRKEKLEKK